MHTVHNLLPHEASAGDRELYSRFINCCDLLVVHNEYCRQLLMKEYQIPEERSVLPLMEAIPRSERGKYRFWAYRPEDTVFAVWHFKAI
mgnify:CR=1 FL=1